MRYNDRLVLIILARPTQAVIDELRAENKELLTAIQRLKDGAGPEQVRPTLQSIRDKDQGARQAVSLLSPLSSSNISLHNPDKTQDGAGESQHVHAAPDRASVNTSPYLSVDECGNFNNFGPSSAWQMAIETPRGVGTATAPNIQNTLVANAALSRQLEHQLATFDELDGVPIDLAIHLLDLHWNRQHHTFLLTYRPAIIRDLLEQGEFGSRFLLNAIFACVSKFSTRTEVCELAAGSHFFRRCDELINQENLLFNPSLPTVVGLLLLGSSYVARGLTTKGWLLTGYALRMIFDLGLHIDREPTADDAIQIEIRRRIFWGAFICDKLQSLYLGRPFAIKLRDAHVSLELNDIMEENEAWTAYVDPTVPSATNAITHGPHVSTCSVSCFQYFCLLSKIMTRIIDEFYVVGATVTGAQSSLRSIDDLLQKWEKNLPDGLRLDPTAHNSSNVVHAPNVMCLHVIYSTLVILLHRPLVADGHLRSASPPAASWKRCSDAAERITRVVSSYRQLYGLRAAPYLISYGLYVACTIHVRNTGANTNEMGVDHRLLLACSLHWLEELAVPNPAVLRTVAIIHKLINTRGVDLSMYPEPAIVGITQTSANTMQGQNSEGAIPSIAATITDTGDYPNFFQSEWNESFSDDILYGVMDQQFSSFGEFMPEVDLLD